jgi:hypothetical protein
MIKKNKEWEKNMEDNENKELTPEEKIEILIEMIEDADNNIDAKRVLIKSDNKDI